MIMNLQFENDTWETFHTMIQGKNLYLFGASSSCEKFLEKYGSSYKIQGIFDNDPRKEGTLFRQYKVIRGDRIQHMNYNTTAVLITSSYMKEIIMQLEGINFHNYCLWGMLSEEPRMWFEDTFSEEARKGLKELEKVLADEVSKELLRKIIRKRDKKIKVWCDLQTNKSYFDTGLLAFGKEEVMVDGGAYTGDTIKQFIETTNDCFKKIYAYEPDEKNYEVLEDQYGNDARIECIQAGLWSENNKVSFDGAGKDGSSVKQSGNSLVMVEKLDGNKRFKEKVTFIKLDVEGSEVEAILGAQELIKSDKPKLAVCIYHRQDDLWKIPLMIHELVPEYKIYIRHQLNVFCDTVMYACIENEVSWQVS